MAYILTGLVILGVLLFAMRLFMRASPETAIRAVIFVVGVVFLVLAIFLAVTGKLAAALPSILAAGMAYWKSRQMAVGAENPKATQRPGSDQMDRDEAYDVLGLKPGASQTEVQVSYKKLMQKLHPDAEGNDYLAQKLNEARETLLEKKPDK